MKTIRAAGSEWMETVVSGLLGLAVVVALAGFLGSVVRVSHEAPRIARVLGSGQQAGAKTLVAGVPTNAPARVGAAVGSRPQPSAMPAVGPRTQDEAGLQGVRG